MVSMFPLGGCSLCPPFCCLFLNYNLCLFYLFFSSSDRCRLALPVRMLVACGVPIAFDRWSFWVHSYAPAFPRCGL